MVTPLSLLFSRNMLWYFDKGNTYSFSSCPKRGMKKNELSSVGKQKFLLKKRIIYKKTDGWYIEFQRVTTSCATNDSEWHQVTANDNGWQRITTSDTTSDNEWQRMTTSGTTNENKWKQMRASKRE